MHLVIEKGKKYFAYQTTALKNCNIRICTLRKDVDISKHKT